MDEFNAALDERFNEALIHISSLKPFMIDLCQNRTFKKAFWLLWATGYKQGYETASEEAQKIIQEEIRGR